MIDEIRVHVIDYGAQRALVARYRDPLTGKHKSKSTKTRNRKKAESFAAKWEHDLRHGRYQAPSKVTWERFRIRFEDEKLPGLSDDYAAVMNAAMNHFETLGIERLGKVDASAISRFQANLRAEGVSESTIRCYLKHLRAALGWAVAQGMMNSIPRIELPKHGRKASKMKGRPISGEEFDRMLAKTADVCPHDAPAWRRYLRGLWLSGLRLSESLALSWDATEAFVVDLDGQHPRFRIWAEGQKSGKDELLPLTPDFAEWLLAEIPAVDRVGRVFPMRGSKGGLLKPDAVGRIVSDIGEKAGVVVDKAAGKYATAHDLRRSFGTRWSKLVKPATLQKLMRHADIKTTATFYVDQDADDIAADLWRSHEGNKSGNKPPVTAENQGTG